MTIKYLEHRKQQLTQAELATIQVDLMPSSGLVTALLFESECPRCHDTTREVVPVEHIAVDTGGPLDDALEILAGAMSSVLSSTAGGGGIHTSRVRVPAGAPGGAPAPAAPAPAGLPVVISCRCAVDHAGAKGKFGCGSSWMIDVTFDPTGVTRNPTVTAASADHLARWADLVAVAASATDPLATVRDSGDKWQKALASAFGGIAVSALVGRDALDKLVAPWDWVLPIAVLASLALTAFGTYKAHQAAIGFPTFKSISTPAQLDAYAANPLAQAKAGVQRLKESSVCGALAFVLALFVIGTTLLADHVSSDATSIKVKLANDQVQCVELGQSATPGTIRFTLDDKAPRDYPLSDIEVLGPC